MNVTKLGKPHKVFEELSFSSFTILNQKNSLFIPHWLRNWKYSPKALAATANKAITRKIAKIFEFILILNNQLQLIKPAFCSLLVICSGTVFIYTIEIFQFKNRNIYWSYKRLLWKQENKFGFSLIQLNVEIEAEYYSFLFKF